MIKIKGLIILFITLSLSLLSQETTKQKNPWKMKTTLGLSYFEGNVEKLDIRGGISVNRKDTVVEYSSSYQFIYGEFNKSRNNLLHDFKLTADFIPYHTYSPFAGFFVFSNIYKGFRLRNSYLLGVKRSLISNDLTKLSLSTAVMYDYILYGSHKNNAEEPDQADQVYRFSVRPKIKTKITDQITFSHVSFWQPEIDRIQNYIFTATTSLDFDVKKNLSLGADYLYYYNSEPPYNSIRKRDQKILLSVKYSI